MTTRIALTTIIASSLAFSARAATPFPEFKVQEIDKTLKVGYGLTVVDLNKDGKPDVVVADSARVVWFDNAGGWRLHTIIDNARAGVKPDNVCLDVADIDGDGKLDVALGADWQPSNTSSGGSLQWLGQGDDIDQPWTVHKIVDSIPTLHRIRFYDWNKGGKPELIVAPLHGKGSTAKGKFMDAPGKIYAFTIPADATGAWPEPQVLTDSLHVTHNIRVDAHRRLVVASAEGVGQIVNTGDGPKWRSAVADEPELRGPGSGEVAIGERFPPAAAIEPFHGNQVVAYTRPPTRRGWPMLRTVIDEQLKGGHALWCANLDGDGIDEIIAGFREPTEKGVGPGINIYRAVQPMAIGTPPKWEKHVLDDKGMACEDLACADLNGDGRVDIVACGRATGNVRIYWNQGAAKP
jgi:hypothetical protein